MTESRSRETSGTQGREGRSLRRAAASRRQRSKPPERPRDGTVTSCVNCDEVFEHVSNSNFLFVHVRFPNCNISAMLDSGSSINLMSKIMYDILHDIAKPKLIPITDDNIV